MRDRTVDRARGHWREILPALGINAGFLNGKHQPCPVCGGRDRARFDNRHNEGDYFCSQCGAGTGITLLMKVHGWDYAMAAARIDEIVGKEPIIVKTSPKTPQLPDRRVLRRLWCESAPIEQGHPAGLYLANRGIERIPTCLRHIRGLRHAEGTLHPGMLALFHGPDGRSSTIHRTWLTEEGQKAPVDPVRMFMPGKIATGGAVRLFPIAPKIGIAEGIETALAAAQIHDFPVWATLTEGLLRTWEPPAEIRNVVIFGDNDENYVGQAAAFELARRLVVIKKISVEVRLPKLVGFDWNDVLIEAMQ